MFPAIKRKLSPRSASDSHTQDNGDAESYADTYFAEIGFKTGDNSLVGSTESPELDGGESMLEDIDRSLGLLEDNSLATDVERAVADLAGPNSSSENNYYYGSQAAATADHDHDQNHSSKSDRPSPSNGTSALTMSKAYNAPFHSYFGAFADREDDEESSTAEIVRPSPRGSYNIAYPNAENAMHSDDVSISTLGEESVRRKPSPLYAQQQRAAAEKGRKTAKQHSPTGTLVPGGVEGSHPPLDELELKKTRTGSTLEDRPSEDWEEHLAKNSTTKAHSRQSSSSRHSTLGEDEAASKKRWRFIYFIMGSALLLLSTAAIVLGFSIAELKNKSDEETDSSSSSNTAWVPELPKDWVKSSPTAAPVVPSTTSQPQPESLFDLVELAQEDLLQIVGTVSPDSLSSISDTTTAQYRAFDWMVHSNPDYFDYSVERVLQRWSMAVLYFSLGGESWQVPPLTSNRRRLSNQTVEWLSDAHECLWYTTDVEDVCDTEGRVVGLHLSNAGLSGSIPPEVSLLSDSLERFYLPFNSITGTLPFEIGDLYHLVRLQLTSNQIQGTLPSEIAKLTNLVVLGLGRNQLSGSLPSALGDLENLSTLGLEGNSMDGNIPTEFGLLTSLEFLTLESNQLDGFLPSEMGMLENLEVLAVHQNQFEGSMPDEICSVANTTNLILSADCAEVECECCTLCCMECEGDESSSGALIQRTSSPSPEPTPVPTAKPAPTTAPSITPTTLFEVLRPAIVDLQEQVAQMVPTVAPQAEGNLWPFVASVGGLTDVPSDAPSRIPSDSPSLLPSRAPSPAPTECVALVAVEHSCFEINGGTLEVEFRNCGATESDWLGVFEDEEDFSDAESSPIGTSAPEEDDAELWLRACGSRQCSVPTNNGTVSFGNGGRLQLKEQDYRVFLVQDGVIMATSQVFEVRRRCDQ